MKDLGSHQYLCNECNADFVMRTKLEVKYCPYCGEDGVTCMDDYYPMERVYECPACMENSTSSSWTWATRKKLYHWYDESQYHWINKWNMDARSINDTVVCPQCWEIVESNYIVEIEPE